MRRLVGQIESKSDEVFKTLTHLILDEVHEHELVTDVLMIVVRDALTSNPHLKVIIMSATLDSEKLSRYFFDCPVINIPGRTYVVTEIFLDTLLFKTKFESDEMRVLLNNMDQLDTTADNEQHSKDFMLDVYNKSRLNLNGIDHKLLCHTITHIHLETPMDESILVFLPGIADITEQKQFIESTDALKNCTLFLLHSGISIQNTEVFERVPPNIRKVILATNIAETSITINDVVCIEHF